MTSYGPIDHALWGAQPESGWLPELHAALEGLPLGEYDARILDWAVRTLDNPTLAVLASLLHRARAAEPLEVHVENKEPASADTLRSGIELLASAHGVVLDGDLLSQLLANTSNEIVLSKAQRSDT